MTWGESWASYGWGDHIPETAKTVAAAFYAGKTRKRGNCETNGCVYYLFGNPIARRIPPGDLPAMVAARLDGRQTWRPLEFTWAGCPTKTTARHLRALGLNVDVYGSKSPQAFFNGKRVDPEKHRAWFTPDEIEHMRDWIDPGEVAAAERRVERAAARARREAEGFVQLTGSLFA